MRSEHICLFFNNQLRHRLDIRVGCGSQRSQESEWQPRGLNRMNLSTQREQILVCSDITRHVLSNRILPGEVNSITEAE